MRPRNRQLDLNAEQRRAVRFGTSCRSSPLLVLAGAGSGKTGVLAHRVAHLIEQGVDRNRILLLTFTRLAATEMTERVAGLIGAAPRTSHHDRSGPVPWAGTFHAIGLRLLRMMGDEIDLDPTFTVLDAHAARSLMGMFAKNSGSLREHRTLPNAKRSIRSRSMRGRRSPTCWMRTTQSTSTSWPS